VGVDTPPIIAVGFNKDCGFLFPVITGAAKTRELVWFERGVAIGVGVVVGVAAAEPPPLEPPDELGTAGVPETEFDAVESPFRLTALIVMG
jgi:hypothetical protein